MPIVAVGNVGQLAVDILIATLFEKKQCKFVGRILSDALIPVCGPDAFKLFSNDVTTTCQIFQSSEHKLVILQQRAPCFKEKRQMYINQLIAWFKSCNFKQIVALSSSFLQFLAPSLYKNEKHPIRYLHTSAFDDSFLKAFDTNDENYKPVVKIDRETLLPSENGIIHLPGSGISKSLLAKCESEQIKIVIFVLYCSEGDNTADAFAYVHHLNACLKLNKNNDPYYWQAPISWQHLYGERYPQEIF
ncbi:proteasome assembly chaperone 2-like protein [Dinothrombium tinctorium]|uniref:Proteasome assembly chaperone 2 n=1 Tax=Dinothrombium tinctorium TaxID=1965070 RepID=A0A443R422_9ACAR|nr:proteasome assembly chaperone 2-like protein [Dinothrombium tinctorium]